MIQHMTNIIQERDDSILFNLAKALLKFQIVHGQIPRILGKGDYSKKLCDLLIKVQKEYVLDTKASGNTLDPFPAYPEYDAMIMLDRNVDYQSVLMTPLNYEGLLDKFYGISTGGLYMHSHCLMGICLQASTV